MDLFDHLFIEIKKGNQEAFRLFFLKTYDRMKYLIMPYLKDDETARDLIQDAYLKFWEARNTLRQNSNPEAFLFTLLRNSALNYLKHKVVGQKYAEAVQEDLKKEKLNYYALSDPVTEKVFSEEMEKILDSALRNLPEKTREIFVLSREKGLKYHEIAVQMNLSEKVVENHIMNALRALRQALKDFFD
jgi:RNA polymerase sigma-70 factor (ECF subfamily)